MIHVSYSFQLNRRRMVCELGEGGTKRSVAIDSACAARVPLESCRLGQDDVTTSYHRSESNHSISWGGTIPKNYNMVCRLFENVRSITCPPAEVGKPISPIYASL